jgi:hypothetical protein
MLSFYTTNDFIAAQDVRRHNFMMMTGRTSKYYSRYKCFHDEFGA